MACLAFEPQDVLGSEQYHFQIRGWEVAEQRSIQTFDEFLRIVRQSIRTVSPRFETAKIDLQDGKVELVG